MSDRSPERIEERIAATTEMLPLAKELGDREKIIDVHALRLYDHLELRDIQSVDADLEAICLKSLQKEPRQIDRTAGQLSIREKNNLFKLCN